MNVLVNSAFSLFFVASFVFVQRNLFDIKKGFRIGYWQNTYSLSHACTTPAPTECGRAESSISPSELTDETLPEGTVPALNASSEASTQEERCSD